MINDHVLITHELVIIRTFILKISCMVVKAYFDILIQEFQNYQVGNDLSPLRVLLTE